MVSESIVVLLTSFEILYDLFLLIGDSKIGGGPKRIVQFFADFSLFSPISTHIVLEGCAIVVSLGG